jgi:hypothetical protein
MFGGKFIAFVSEVMSKAELSNLSLEKLSALDALDFTLDEALYKLMNGQEKPWFWGNGFQLRKNFKMFESGHIRHSANCFCD